MRRQEVSRRALLAVARDCAATLPAIRHPDLGEEQLQMVVQLGHRPDGRARRLDRPALIDRDRREDPLDALDARPVHAIEELSRIGGEALDVAPLALRIEDVEGEARLARAGDAGDHGHGVQRHADVDALQVVLARTDDDDRGRVHDVCGTARDARGNW